MLGRWMGGGCFWEVLVEAGVRIVVEAVERRSSRYEFLKGIVLSK